MEHESGIEPLSPALAGGFLSTGLKVKFFTAYLYHKFFIHQCKLKCFHVSAVVNNLWYRGAGIFVSVFVSSGYIPRSRISGSCDTTVLILIFWGLLIPFFIIAALIYIPTNTQWFSFLPIFAKTCYFLSFCNSHSNRYKVISCFKKILSFIYLAVPGLSCGMQDL